MSKSSSVLDNIIHKMWIIYYLLASTRLLLWVPDSIHLKFMFRGRVGYKLNLDNPQTFNEKIQWLKLHDRNPEYTKMVDKYAVRQYIKDTIGEEYLIPLLGVWDKFDDIDFDSLPNQFVLKCNHDSGTAIICKDKSTFDIKAARKKINHALSRNYYCSGREWPYKNIHHKIIAEKYMVDESGIELKDYKVFTFNSVPKLIQVDFGRFSTHLRNIYTTDWKYVPLSILYPTAPDHQIDKPAPLQELLELSKKLSKGIPHVRTDFYIIKDKIYFGELTFYHGSGYEPFTPNEWNYTMGSWIELPKQ